MGVAGMKRGPIVGVIGAGSCSEEIEEAAMEVGRELARNNATIVCGGLGGVMTAAAKGAKEIGGFTVGILPGASNGDANPYIDFPVATNMGQARNAIIVQTADILIAIAGGYGTLSEIGLALKIGKAVVALHNRFAIPGVYNEQTPFDAVKKALTILRGASPSRDVG